MHLVYFPKVCITIVSNVSCVLQSSQEKLKTMVIQFGGGGGGGGGGEEGAYVKMVIWTIAFNIRTPQSPLFTSVLSKFSKCKHIFSLRKRNPKTDFDRQEFL